MRIDVYVHDAQTDEIRSDLAGLRSLIMQVLNKETIEMAEIDDLKAAVAAEKTVEDSAVALIQGLVQKINDASTAATDLAALKASIADVTSTVNADAQGLAAAVQANTPAAPPAP